MVLERSCLIPDLELLPDGDLTEIGEKGEFGCIGAIFNSDDEQRHQFEWGSTTESEYFFPTCMVDLTRVFLGQYCARSLL